ncbi:MAG: ATP-binding cassette domain-containing protein [Methanoculleaceae archaeon]
MNCENAIEALELEKAFNGMAAVDGISFSVHRGEIFGLLGPNGAGKTTAVRMLTGVIRPDAGSAWILGHDIVRTPVRAKQLFGVVPETANAYDDLTAMQNLMLVAGLYGLDRSDAARRAARLLTDLGLYDRRDSKVHGFSKGMKQRLILAMALLHEPDLLFLDEPTTGLDVRSTHLIHSMLRELNDAGTTIFLTTHNMEEANRLCDRVAIMRAGRIIALDAPDCLKMEVERLHRVEVIFDGQVEAGAIEDLDGVLSTCREGDRWVISTADLDTTIRAIVRFAGGRGLRIVRLNTPAPTLDEVFLRLTEGEG